MKVSAKRFRWLAWGLTGLLCLLAILIYGDSIRWDPSKISAYRLFPLFGLLTYAIFLSHYIVSTLRQIVGLDKSVIADYFYSTSWIALGTLLLHPSLLIGQLLLDGYGLPPQSYLENYVAPSLKWAAALGSLSLFMFLAYELTRVVKLARYKPLLQALSDIAMILIFFHGLALGTHLQSGWFRTVWLMQGIILVLCLGYTYGQLIRGKLNKPKESKK